MAQKQKITIDQFSDVQVKLKPFMGFNPASYLKILYASILLLVAFSLFLLPGILHFGSLVTLDSMPNRASIYIDGKRVGSSPMQLFLPAGTYTIEYHKPFFYTTQEIITVKGRRFFSLFMPKKLSIQPQIQLADIEGLLLTSFEQASFSYSTTLRKEFPREPFLLHTLDDLAWSGAINVYKDMILRWAADAWSIIGDQDSLEDVALLWRSLKQMGLPIDAGVMTGIKFDLEEPKLTDIIQYQQDLANYPASNSNEFYQSVNNNQPLNILGLRFNYQAPTSFLMGDPAQASLREFSSTVTLPEFYYMPELITYAQFNRIIGSLPTRDDQSDVLHNRFDPSIQQDPVTYVSLFLAQAFILQINQELEQQKSPWRARLPLESEWEWLTQSKLLETHYYEWMQEAYYPLKNLLFATRPTVYTQFKPFLHSVRGYDPVADRSGQNAHFLRGASDPQWQSPFISFRVVLERI